ncbi:AGE family epimerase/isomerase [Saccharomonospora saliphila]|uniref:AGE family epimerase/isomerase n=1 Tax=Saccharomonospora saliphila TaxID=369829 RepID=UPI000371503D|nr:AGE family epimerase/isomerase [Saccharomonospora saliphila]
MSEHKPGARPEHGPGGDAAGSRPWRRREVERLLGFAARSALDEGGFGHLDRHGTVDVSRDRELWITCRMTHVFGLAALAGHSGARELARHGVDALRSAFHDDEHGGWFTALDPRGAPRASGKAAYDHAFVLLAASTAHAARLPGAAELLDEACEVVDVRFFSEEEGLCVESFARDWSGCEDYRGANSNMHAVEAFTACAAVTGRSRWHARALSIAETLINRHAREHHWRVPEHFTPEWSPIPDYNDGARADPFRPYGTTVGHWLEWSRLLLGLHAADDRAPSWLPEAARALFEEAVRRGWAADGRPGFAYTLDWDDRVVVAERLHWVHAEALLAADALHRATGHARAGELARAWWSFADEHFRDPDTGSWHHELSPALRPSTTIWNGKPDAYHVYQALVLPDLPPARAPAAALAARGAR